MERHPIGRPVRVFMKRLETIWTYRPRRPEPLRIVTPRNIVGIESLALFVTSPHYQGEVVGVVVNKPTEIAVSTHFPQSELKDEHSQQLYFGGPVSGQSLLFLIRSKKQPKASLRILDNVFLSADRKVLEQVLRHPKPFAGLRIFSGYAGWKPGQLEAEVKKGYWLLREADTEILFHTDPGRIWRKLLDSSSRGYLVNLMKNQSVI